MCIPNNYGSTQKNEEVKILSTHLDIKYIMFQTSLYWGGVEAGRDNVGREEERLIEGSKTESIAEFV